MTHANSNYFTKINFDTEIKFLTHASLCGVGSNLALSFATRMLLNRKLEGKRPLERPRHRWEDGNKMDLREIGWGVWSGFTWLGIGTVGGLL
jgi:hypothetical protein